MDAESRTLLYALDRAAHLRLEMNRRKFLQIASGTIAIQPLLAACGGDDDSEETPTAAAGSTASTTTANAATVTSATSSGANPTSATAGETPVASAPTEATGEDVQQGGTLTLGVDYDTPIFDPLRTTSSARGSTVIYEGLVIRNDIGEYQPWLASGWDVAADGLTVTFSLRDDVTFQDDTPFNAEAVKWFFDKAMDPDGAFSFQSTLAPVDEVVADDEFTVMFRLNGPFPGLMEFLGESNYMYTGMLSPAAYETAGEDFGVSVAVGTGPFTLEEWIPNDVMSFVRYDAYAWAPSARAVNPGPAILEKLVYRYIPETASRVAALETGQFDILFATPVQDYERLKATEQFEFHTPPQYGGNLTFLGSNKSRPVFQDLNVRRAFSYAIDRESIQRVVFPVNGQVAYSMLPPHFPSAYPDAESLGFHYDSDMANQLLDEAGWVMGSDDVREKDGQQMSFSLMTTSAPDATATAQIIQQNLKDIGIETTITQLESWTTLRPTLLEGDYDIWLGGTGWSSPTILDFFFGEQSGSNVDHVTDQMVFDLLAATGQASTITERDAKYQELDKYLTEQGIWVPIVFLNDIVAVNKRVKGFRFTPAGEQTSPTDWAIAAE